MSPSLDSFEEAVAGKPPTSDPGHNAQYERKLAAAELTLRQHEHRLKTIDYEAEVVEREFNQLCLVLYGVSEQLQDDTD